MVEWFMFIAAVLPSAQHLIELSVSVALSVCTVLIIYLSLYINISYPRY